MGFCCRCCSSSTWFKVLRSCLCFTSRRKVALSISEDTTLVSLSSCFSVRGCLQTSRRLLPRHWSSSCCVSSFESTTLTPARKWSRYSLPWTMVGLYSSWRFLMRPSSYSLTVVCIILQWIIISKHASILLENSIIVSVSFFIWTKPCDSNSASTSTAGSASTIVTLLNES